ncbi:hypothetical protein [Halomarina oriensis]|uniref:DUF2238 domain-containing protein n=1 Tax=Halomarina oriensis TaxID=671145 RepID=A0A6B0GUE3_9EURY|nr:hypothetical protein [Halomarina oriensis]MWG35755.1 hypothetical protein [Halomarina oriensis]
MSERTPSTEAARRRRLSPARESALVRVLQVLIAGMFLVGLLTGNGGVAVNAGVGLLVTFLPNLLARRFDLTLGVGLVLWITAAMFLHALGTLAIPGIDFTLYAGTWWWDHLTHAMSSSLVAGAALATLLALQQYSTAIRLPPRFMFLAILLFVMAFGVVWELLEFYIGVVSSLLGANEVLTQYGLGDTVLDLFYNTMGGLVVAALGASRLSSVSTQLADRMRTRSSGQ